jgi:imidazolonepropionase-like amidohydrolase
MLAGSDLGGWLIHGFSLHQEFHEPVAAGLSPLEILQMTTLNAAEFLGRQSTLGAVEEGKSANLVVLNANPLETVSNLDRISAVLLKGRYFSESALEQLKREAAAGYASADAC